MNNKTTTTTASALNVPGLSQGERQFLQSILEFLEQAKEHPAADVALAARRWDRAIGFFMKVRLRKRFGTPVDDGDAVERVPTNIHVDNGDAVEALAGSQVPTSIRVWKEAA